MWELKSHTLTANSLWGGEENNPAGRELSPFSLSVDILYFAILNLTLVSLLLLKF